MSAWADEIVGYAVNRWGALQDPTELAEFIDHIRPLQARVLVEIGTHAGGCWHALTHAAHPEALCISIDYECYSTEYSLKALALPGQTVHKIKANSHDWDTRLELQRILGYERDIDVLFIDGDHHYESVKRDHELYAPLVRDGGIVGFHDITRDASCEPGCEVIDYWPTIRARAANGYTEHRHNPCFGIGTYTAPLAGADKVPVPTTR